MDFIKITKALSDSTRFEILRKIGETEEIYCTKLSDMLPVTQPAISHHLKILGEADLIKGRKEGQHLHLSINRPVLKEYTRYLKTTLSF